MTRRGPSSNGLTGTGCPKAPCHVSIATIRMAASRRDPSRPSLATSQDASNAMVTNADLSRSSTHRCGWKAARVAIRLTGRRIPECSSGTSSASSAWSAHGHVKVGPQSDERRRGRRDEHSSGVRKGCSEPQRYGEWIGRDCEWRP